MEKRIFSSGGGTLSDILIILCKEDFLFTGNEARPLG